MLKSLKKKQNRITRKKTQINGSYTANPESFRPQKSRPLSQSMEIGWHLHP